MSLHYKNSCLLTLYQLLFILFKRAAFSSGVWKMLIICFTGQSPRTPPVSHHSTASILTHSHTLTLTHTQHGLPPYAQVSITMRQGPHKDSIRYQRDVLAKLAIKCGGGGVEGPLGEGETNSHSSNWGKCLLKTGCWSEMVKAKETWRGGCEGCAR